MMAARIAGFICCQSPASLVTEMKSLPKNTPLTLGSRTAAPRAAIASLRPCRHVERAVGEHRLAGQEFQRGRIRRRFGLDEHGSLLRARLGRQGRSSLRLCRLLTKYWPRDRNRRSTHDRSRWQASRHASMSSSLRWPGTIATGIGKRRRSWPNWSPAGRAPPCRCRRRAPGWRCPRPRRSASAFLGLVAFADHALRHDAGDLVARRGGRSSAAFAASCASARMMSATPSHCWFRSWVSITRSMITLAPMRAPGGWRNRPRGRIPACRR